MLRLCIAGGGGTIWAGGKGVADRHTRGRAWRTGTPGVCGLRAWGERYELREKADSWSVYAIRACPRWFLTRWLIRACPRWFTLSTLVYPPRRSGETRPYNSATPQDIPKGGGGASNEHGGRAGEPRSSLHQAQHPASLLTARTESRQALDSTLRPPGVVHTRRPADRRALAEGSEDAGPGST